MKRKISLSILLVLLLVCSIVFFASCDESGDTPGDKTTPGAETTTIPDNTTEQPGNTTEPDNTTVPDNTTAKPDITTEPDSTTAKPDITTEPDNTTAKPDNTTEPDSTTEPDHPHSHSFGGWGPSANSENKHERFCNCGEKETGDCSFDNGKVTREPTHFEEGVKTYTCTECGRTKDEAIAKTEDHLFGDWYPSQESEDKHERICKCGETETADCVFDDGKVTQEPTHFEEGIKTYTCAECGRTKTESVPKTTDHTFGDWAPDITTENKHIRECKCGETEIGNCSFDNGVVTKEPSHFEEGIKTYTCTECGRTKTEPIEKNDNHSFGGWYPSAESEDKHERVCNCGEKETADCAFDEGKVTKEPSHFEEGIKTYTCTECGRTKEEAIAKTDSHLFGDWYPSEESDDKHERICKCGEKETGDCAFDEGKVTKEPTHFEEGIKTYTCTECGRTKTEPIEKNDNHSFGDWYPSAESEDKHERVCNCGEKETGDCTFDAGKVTKEPTHFEEGIKTYTCTVCGRIKTESVPKTADHTFGDWAPDITTEDKHIRECKCGETETGDCSFDNGAITKEPTHLEEGIKTYTCTVCGRIKTEPVEKTPGHSFGQWTPDETSEDKHYRECACGETETGDCTFDPERGTCTVCGREKPEEEGIIIVIYGGSATFEGKETVTSGSKIYGENAKVYIAQENDVLNVTLTDQAGRTFKHWVSASGTVIPDEDFSILVFRSGYYYPVFEDTEEAAFSSRVKIFEGNCEEGILYMSTNSKGDVKYELEFVNFGHHDFAESVNHNSQYHKQVCSICGETVFEEHTEDDSEIEKEAGHTEEGIIKYECFCGHTWTESIPTTDEHTIDYDDWHIVEESKNGQYGKYRVYCKYCDYYEEYWYLGGLDFVGFMDGKMINYQYTYGGKVCHDEYYYSYRNAEGKKVYIWAFQYEYAYSSNKDYNDTYIFMYIDDEDPTTLEPVYLSKSKGDRKAAYLWAIYGYVYDVNGWIDLLDYPDRNIGCSGGMSMGNSMSARASVLESYHDQWAETYNKLRIPTSKAYDDLSDTVWEIYHEGESFGGREVIGYVKDKATSLQKYFYVDKATGITYGYEDFGTAYRTVFIMRQYKTIVSPEEFEKLDEAGKSVSYSYGDIEKDIKSLCAKRNAFNNFTLTVPNEASAFRLSVDFLIDDLVDLGGYYASVYYNTAQVFDSGSYITFTWVGEDGLVFDRYEIWDFVNQKWVVLSESPEFTFNTSDDPRREAAYVRVIYHDADAPADPDETFRITVENGYFEIDGKEYTGTVEVPAGTFVYVWPNEVAGKTFDHWVLGNGEEFDDYEFTVTSDMTLSPVYTDTVYNIYCQGWNYDSYVSVNGGEMHYTDEFEGKAVETVQLNTTYDPDYGCTVFLGWYLETYGPNGREYVLISDKQAFTYTITGKEQGCLYAVWTTGENPMIKKYVDIRVVNGFVIYAGGEGISEIRDNAYSAISLSSDGRVRFFDDPTDETVYTAWDVAYRYELEGEVQHELAESYEDEDDYQPAEYWVSDPEYSYPDGEINVTGTINESAEIPE